MRSLIFTYTLNFKGHYRVLCRVANHDYPGCCPSRAFRTLSCCQRICFGSNDSGAVFSHGDAAVKTEEAVKIAFSLKLDARPAGVEMRRLHPYVTSTVVVDNSGATASVGCHPKPLFLTLDVALEPLRAAVYYMSHLAFAERHIRSLACGDCSSTTHTCFFGASLFG